MSEQFPDARLWEEVKAEIPDSDDPAVIAAGQSLRRQIRERSGLPPGIEEGIETEEPPTALGDEEEKYR